MIPKTRWRENTIVFSCILTVWLIVGFFIYGVWAAVWSVPDKKAEIELLQIRVDSYQAAVEKYQSAMKFENLFMLVANPNAVMDFEELEGYIQDRKDFYKRVE